MISLFITRAPWYEAIIARARPVTRKKPAPTFTAARKILEERLTIEARRCAHDCRSSRRWTRASGDKEVAIAEATACGQVDAGLSRDAYDGALLVLQGLAQVYTWTGENEKALELVRQS